MLQITYDDVNVCFGPPNQDALARNLFCRPLLLQHFHAICHFTQIAENNYKFGAKPNVSPSGALSPITSNYTVTEITDDRG